MSLKGDRKADIWKSREVTPKYRRLSIRF